jgi:hypothetical protein
VVSNSWKHLGIVMVLASYRGETYELWLVLATGVRPVSSWPLVTVSNLVAFSCLDVVYVQVLSLQLNHILHIIISYTCGVLNVLTLAIFPIYYCYALLLRK